MVPRLNRSNVIPALLFALLLWALPFFVSAQSEKLQSALEQVQESAGLIDETSDLASRKTALQNIFDLTKAEISDLLSKNLSASDSLLISRYTARMNLLEQQLASSHLTLDGLKTMASDFADWRKQIYEPETKQMLNNLLLAQAEQVFETAQNRLNKITADIGRLTLITTPADTKILNRSLTAAKKNLDAAKMLIDASAADVRANEPQPAKDQDTIARLMGSFSCLPTDTTLTSPCILLFRKTDGKAYTLQLSPELIARGASVREIVRARGTIITAVPAYIDNATVGIIELQGINEVNVDQTALLLVTAPAVPLVPAHDITGMVQEHMRQIYTGITSAYKTFLAMSKIAKKY